MNDDLLGDLDGRHRQPEPDADPRHREGEQQEQRDPAEEAARIPLWTLQPTSEPGQHQDDEDAAVVDDVGDGVGR